MRVTKKHIRLLSSIRSSGQIILFFLIVFISRVVSAQNMSISTATVTVNPQTGVAFDLSQNPGSNTANSAVAEGFVLPCLTTGQMNAISASAPAGLLLYNTTTQCYEIYSGTTWNSFWCLCTGSPPSITAGATSTSVCTGSTIYLTASGGASIYTWTGPNGFTSSQQNPTITSAVVGDAGTYSVTASNGCGSSPISTVNISVAAGTTQTAGVTASPYCAGSTVNLTCTNTGGTVTGYSWSGPNGFTSASQNPSIASATTAASGTYTVICTEGACSISSTVAVVVNASPSAPTPISELDSLTGATYVGPACDPGCVAIGQTLQFSVPNTAGNTYTWSVTRGTIIGSSTGSSITVQWTAAGSNEITVTQTSSSGCTSASNAIYVTVSSQCSCTFNTCGAHVSFTVPAGMHSVAIDMAGGGGGDSWSEWTVQSCAPCSGVTPLVSPCAEGARVRATYATSAGTTLYADVGCKGGTGSSTTAGAAGSGGYSGDESGGTGTIWTTIAGGSCVEPASYLESSSGGGGGASDLRSGSTALASRVLVAGGAGGDFVQYIEADGGQLTTTWYNTNWWNGPATPSCGGAPNGSNGGYGGGTNAGGVCGHGNEFGLGATTAAAGAAGVSSNINTNGGACPDPTQATCTGTAATAGSGGIGGNGGLQGYTNGCNSGCNFNPGGGGGGGYYGGGGGFGAGGGGGSSYPAANGGAISGLTFTASYETGNGYVTITW